MIVLWILLGALGVVLLTAVVRTLLLRPTQAHTASLPESDPKLATEYGKKLGEMLRCETVSYREQTDIAKFEAYQKTLKKLFPHVFTTCEEHLFDGSLLLCWKGKSSGKPILLMSHQDVVEANGQWKHAPFSGEIADGAVWGRGAVDTKCNMFCFLQAAEELIASGYTPTVDVYLAGSCTEEWSGPGAKRTAEWLRDNGVELSLLLDEGGMIMENPMAGVEGVYAMVGVLEKGYGDVKFSAKSAGGHASAPGLRTPWVRLAQFIAHVEKHDPFKKEFEPTVREMFRRLAPNMAFGMRMIFSNLWLFGPLLKHLMRSISPAGAAMLQTTLAFTKGSGSDGYNVLPAEAYVTGNMRFIPHEGTQESIQKITAIAKKFGVDTEIITAEQPCAVVPYTGAAFELIEQAMAAVYPCVGVSPYVMTGGTDAKDYDIVCENALRFAPLYINAQQLGSIHGIDENIDCAALVPGVSFFKYIIENSK